MRVVLLSAETANLRERRAHIVGLTGYQRSHIRWQCLLQYIGISLFRKVLPAFTFVENCAVGVILHARLHSHPASMNDCRHMPEIGWLATQAANLDFKLMRERCAL